MQINLPKRGYIYIYKITLEIRIYFSNTFKVIFNKIFAYFQYIYTIVVIL
jgi:hypothetical protein